jgi:proteic killer suppression protein
MGRTSITLKGEARKPIKSNNVAVALTDLRVPPGNELEALKRDRRGQHSIRINNQWRICFIWKATGAYDVEIVDYH